MEYKDISETTVNSNTSLKAPPALKRRVYIPMYPSAIFKSNVISPFESVIFFLFGIVIGFPIDPPY